MTHTSPMWIPCDLSPPPAVGIVVSNIDFTFLIGKFHVSNSLEVKESPLWVAYSVGDHNMRPKTTRHDSWGSTSPQTPSQDRYNSKCDKSLHGLSPQPPSMCANLSPTFYDVWCPSSSTFALGLSLQVSPRKHRSIFM
jgi:hypothetical protein